MLSNERTRYFIGVKSSIFNEVTITTLKYMIANEIEEYQDLLLTKVYVDDDPFYLFKKNEFIRSDELYILKAMVYR